MKIILSRKGFDSKYGQQPSPIFPNGTMLSLPIPSELWDGSTVTYNDLSYSPTASIGNVLQYLNARNGRNERILPTDSVHLDPDLTRNPFHRNSRQRTDGWRPLFGQRGGSSTHLQNQRVDPGDVFLFFGTFSKVISKDEKWEYHSEKMHVVFGWLQIESRILASLPSKRIDPRWVSERPWALDHPHLQPGFIEHNDPKKNVIYVAAEHLSLPGLQNIASGGTFPSFSEKLRLTKSGCGVTTWKLPLWFWPKGKPSFLSHNNNLTKWREHPDHVELDSAAPGQEFVLNCDHYPEAIPWLRELFEDVKP